jgi:hypothetical protein
MLSDRPWSTELVRPVSLAKVYGLWTGLSRPGPINSGYDLQAGLAGDALQAILTSNNCSTGSSSNCSSVSLLGR